MTILTDGAFYWPGAGLDIPAGESEVSDDLGKALVDAGLAKPAKAGKTSKAGTPPESE